MRAYLNALAVAALPVVWAGSSAVPHAQSAADSVPPAPGALIAVIPFSNISGAPTDAWIGRGIADTVMTDLARVGGLTVIRREVVLDAMRVLNASGADESVVLDVGRRLAATWLVNGGYQRLGDQIRITARSVDVATGEVVHAIKVDGTVSELFALQDRIGAELSSELTLEAIGRSVTGGGRPERPAGPGRGALPAVVRGNGGDTETTGSGTAAPRTAPAGGAVIEPPRPPHLEPVDRTMPVRMRPGAAALPDPEHQGDRPVDPVGLAMTPIVPADVDIDGPPPPVPPAVISRDAQGRATVRAIQLIAPLRIDGRLDEALYTSVPPISDFIQTEPTASAPATEKTEVWIAFNRANIYVAVRAWHSRPDRMVVNEMRRDSMNIFQNENFSFIFDTYYDRRNGVEFAFTPHGGRTDAQFTNESQYNGDWNPIWELAVGRFDGGWTAEAALPFKSLRYRPGRAQIWGFNARRFNPWKNEISHLTPIPNALGQLGLMHSSLAATLVGLEVPSGSRNLEIKPYAISDLTSDTTATPRISNDLGGDFGLDVKYGLTQNLTADFTYNTDFAQVEADQQQVNLTRFSLFFPEKREFFLENRGLFQFGGAGGRRSRDGGGTPTSLFQPPHRPRSGPRNPDRGGRPAHGPAGRVQPGPAQHSDR